MSRTDIAFYLSLLGLVGVAAGVIRIVEFLSTLRHQLAASLKPDPEGDGDGDEIIIFNGSSRPWNIHSFSLEWTKNSHFTRWIPFRWKRLKTEFDLSGDVSNITVAAHGQYRMSFTDSDMISWKAHPKDDLYLVLWLTGRNRPVRIRLF